jgi:phage terminase small subunit
MTKRRLTLLPKQRAFIDHYLVTHDTEQAAIAAGYSRHSARQTGGNLLRKPLIDAEIQREIEARSARTRITADRVLMELARVGFSDIGRFAHWTKEEGVELLSAAELAEEDRAAIAELVMDGKTHVRIKLHDKIRALQLIAKHLRMIGSAREREEIVPYGTDIRTDAQNRARKALKERIEKIIAEQGKQQLAPPPQEADNKPDENIIPPPWWGGTGGR